MLRQLWGRRFHRHFTHHTRLNVYLWRGAAYNVVNVIYMPKRKYIMRDAMCSANPSTKYIERLVYNIIVHIWTRIRLDNS
jgi:hypothetical protein